MDTALRIAGFAETYERVLVPSIFSHWSEEILERARPVGPSDRILDVGCGTGIVARRMRDRLGGRARIIGVDANAEMIAMARSLEPSVDFRVADATRLPFEDESFELAVSQQMLQFVPDPLVALREMARVLTPGGRLILATWRSRDELPLFEALGRVAEQHLGTPNERRFALGDESRVRALVADSGLSDVRVEVVTRIDRFAEFPYRGSALAANFDLSGMSADEREARLAAVEAASKEAAKPFATDGSIAAPSRANVVTAVKPR